MAQKSEDKSTENENEMVGMFLLNMFHKGYFGSERLIEKRLLRSEFRAYAANKNFPWDYHKMGAFLNKYNFLQHNYKDTNRFQINGKTFWDFRRNIIAKMDDIQIKKNFSTQTNMSNEEKPNMENVEIDPDLPVYDLEFKQRVVKKNNTEIVVSSKGCFICQLNFTTETDYDEHIKSHGTDSDYKESKTEEFQKSDVNNFDIKYSHCKNSYCLYFTISNLGQDIVIDKIVIVQSDAMIYLLEENVPVTSLKRSKVEFLVDCHLFEIGYEYPIFILYRFKTIEKLRFVEEHQFLRLVPFPLVTNIKLKSNRIRSRGQLEFKKKLPRYFPSKKTEDLCKARDLSEELIKNHNVVMRNYLDNHQSLNASNAVDVFTLLLEIEDIVIRKECSALNQSQRCIKGFGKDYSVKLVKVNNVNIQDILSEGDDIILSGKEKKYYGIVNRICGKSIYFYFRDKFPSTSEKYDILFKPNRFQIMAQREALEIFRKKPFLEKMLFPTVNYIQEPSTKRLSMFNTSVYSNQQQEEAVMNIVDAPYENIPHIIFGPPGTGKTTTVVECILQIWKQIAISRILVVAGSNAACDEVTLRLLNRILKLDPDGTNVLRLYAAAAEKRVGSLDPNLLESSNLCHGYHFYPPLETLGTYRIIACTLSVSGKLYQGNIGENFFSHVFIDECAASTETEALVPICGLMSPKCKLILSGDSKQLGPILKSKVSNDLGLKTSLLERLLDRPCYQKDMRSEKYNKTILTRLVQNFRNHPDILHISNELYYNRELIPCADKELTHWAIGWHLLPQKNVPIIFHAVRGRSEREGMSKSLCNYAEINIVMDYVKDLMFFGVNGRIVQECDIGIVTPYKKQYSLIRAQLDQRKWFDIETGSVETFQGKEKPIILFSTVRSDTKTLGFLDNPKRLNVSLTRAQALLIIIGNPQTLSISDDWKYVVEYCTEKGVVCGAKSLSATSIETNNKSLNSSVSDISSLTNSLPNLSVDQKKTRGQNRQKSRTRNHRMQGKYNNIPNVKEEFKRKNIGEWLLKQDKTSVENCMGVNKSTDKFEGLASTASPTNINKPNIHSPNKVPINNVPCGVVKPYSMSTNSNIRNKIELNTTTNFDPSKKPTIGTSPTEYYNSHPYRIITESDEWKNELTNNLSTNTNQNSRNPPQTVNICGTQVSPTGNVIGHSKPTINNITPEKKEKSKNSKCSVM